jgi:hypothetical protein
MAAAVEVVAALELGEVAAVVALELWFPLRGDVAADVEDVNGR